jgi:AAA domain
VTTKGKHHRFPRLRPDEEKSDFQHVLENIPRLDLAKIKDSHPLIDNFVVEGCIQVGYGKFGTRKTTVHLLAAWAVSQGIPFLGKKTRRRMVLYLDYENPAGVLKQYCKDLGLNPDDPHFTVWDRTKEYPPLPGDKDDDRLDRFIRRCKKVTGHYPWIIFDSWTSLLRAGDSGDKLGEATPIFRAIRAYCDQGATCTIIDHTGKKGNDPIGTSAKMTQMDTAHFFSVQEDEISLDGQSSRAVVRIENFLKRFAPKDIGTFSIEIKAAMDDKGEWHTLSVEPTKDKAVIRQEKEIEGMKHLIQSNPNLGHEDLAKLAAKEKIVSGRDRARRLLQDGLEKHWKTIPSGSKKLIFRVLKASSNTPIR